jgi:hypothetical protein
MLQDKGPVAPPVISRCKTALRRSVGTALVNQVRTDPTAHAAGRVHQPRSNVDLAATLVEGDEIPGDTEMEYFEDNVVAGVTVERAICLG